MKHDFQPPPGSSSEGITWWEKFKRWTGWPGKTLWDWQAILFVPAILALAGTWVANAINDRQQDLENFRAERAIVEAYLEDMGTLMLEGDLRQKGEESDVRLLARARTLAALDAVTGYRKVRLLEFLHETDLIRKESPDEPPVISLRFADLSNAPLVRRHILQGADLEQAQLDGANMNKIRLKGADLMGADLREADLRGANLKGADLTEADLTDVEGGVRCQETEGVQSLEGATMPNGLNYKDWLKGKGGCNTS